VPLVLAKGQLPVGYVSVSIMLKETPSLCFLTRLHSFRNDIGQPALADHLPDMLTIELAVHQHVINADEGFGGSWPRPAETTDPIRTEAVNYAFLRA
jgi:hypothetical protein